MDDTPECDTDLESKKIKGLIVGWKCKDQLGRDLIFDVVPRNSGKITINSVLDVYSKDADDETVVMGSIIPWYDPKANKQSEPSIAFDQCGGEPSAYLRQRELKSNKGLAKVAPREICWLTWHNHREVIWHRLGTSGD